MGIIFSSLKYCCCGDLDSDSDSEDASAQEEINNLHFEELKQSLKNFMIYRQCR